MRKISLMLMSPADDILTDYIRDTGTFGERYRFPEPAYHRRVRLISHA